MRESWCEGLSSAGDNFAVLDETFYHPMTFTATQYTAVNANLAQIIISVIAGAAMIVLIGYRAVAIVAVHRIRARL